jgi:purine-binding chemotaxis protein CheW
MSAAVVPSRTGWCTFALGNALYGVELDRTHEVLRPQPLTPLPLSPPAIAGLLNLRGQIVPVVNLHALFDLPGNPHPGGLVVVRGPDGLTALAVDGIGDVQRHGEPVRRSPDAHSEDAALVAATVPLPDRLLVVLDLDRLLDRAFARGEAGPSARSRPAARHLHGD